MIIGRAKSKWKKLRLTIKKGGNMKNLFIGVVIGLVLGSTGSYVVLKEKVKKAATKENAEKVVKASQDFGDTIKAVFK